MGLGGGVPGHVSRSHVPRTKDWVNGKGGWGRMTWLEGRGFIMGRIGDIAVMVEE